MFLVNTYFSSFKFLLSSYDCILFYIKNFNFLLRENVILCCDDFFLCAEHYLFSGFNVETFRKVKPRGFCSESDATNSSSLATLGFEPLLFRWESNSPRFYPFCVYGSSCKFLCFYLIWFDKKNYCAVHSILNGAVSRDIIRRAKLRTAKF